MDSPELNSPNLNPLSLNSFYPNSPNLDSTNLIQPVELGRDPVICSVEGGWYYKQKIPLGRNSS
jgi:hypothetical protein